MKIDTYDPISYAIVNASNDSYVLVYNYPVETKYLEIKIGGQTFMRRYVDGAETKIKMQDIYQAYWLKKYSKVEPKWSGLGVRSSFVFQANTYFYAYDSGGAQIDSKVLLYTPVGSWLKKGKTTSQSPYKINDYHKQNQQKYGYAWRRPVQGKKNFPFSIGVGLADLNYIKIVNGSTVLYQSGNLPFSAYEILLADGEHLETGTSDWERIQIFDKNDNLKFDIVGKRQNCAGDIYLRWYAPLEFGYKYGFFDVVKIEYSGQTSEWEGLTFESMINGLQPKVSAKMVVRKVMRDDYDRMYFADFLRAPMIWLWDDQTKVWYNVRHETLQWQEVERNEIIATIKIPAKWW